MMMPLAGPRSLIGPITVSNGSFPKLLLQEQHHVLRPGVSAATAAWTASDTSAADIPTSSGRLCCQSRRSGKYAVGFAPARACTALARPAAAADARQSDRTATMTISLADENDGFPGVTYRRMLRISSSLAAV